MPSIRSIISNFLSFGLGAIERPKPFTPQGVSGTAIYAGYPVQREKSPKWIGQQKYITSADLVLNTSIIAASVHYFLNLIAHPEWSVRPADDKSREAQDVADLIEKAMHDMQTPWPRVVRRAAMYRFHGFGIQEWWAKKDVDGNVIYGDVEPRPQFTIERWDVDESGAVTGVYQRSPHTGNIIGLPRSKVIYLVDDTLSDSPEGIGIFRHLAEPYERLMNYQQLEVRAYERDLRGTPIGRAPLTLINRAISDGTITKEEGNSLIAHLKDFVQTEIKKSDTGVVLDSMIYETQSATGIGLSGTQQWGIDLLTGSGSGLGELSNVIDRIQREMARIIGTENLMLGDAGGGSRALASDKSRNLYLIANAVVNNIATTYESDFTLPLLDLNGIDHELKPSFEVEEVAFKDVGEVTNALATMARSGAVLAPDDPAIGDVRDLLGISRPPEPTAAMLGANTTQPQPGPRQAASGTEAAATATVEAAKKFRRRLGKYNPNHDPETGEFSSGGGPGSATPGTGPGVGGHEHGALVPIPSQNTPAAMQRVSNAIKAWSNHPAVKDIVDGVVAKLPHVTFHETVTGLATTIAINALMPHAGFTVSLIAGAVATAPVEYVMEKLNINATTSKEFLLNTVNALIEYRRNQLQSGQGGILGDVANLTTGRSTNKAVNGNGNHPIESDAILTYLQSMKAALEAYEPPQEETVPEGEVEKAWLAKASPEDIQAWNNYKAWAVRERLQKVITQYGGPQ